MSVDQNIISINERIRGALERSGRTDSVSVLAATKYADIAQIKEAIVSGIRLIGENRVKEALGKFPSLPPVEKHMIGHLQTNKVKLAVKYFDCIQSVDSFRLAKKISRRAGKKMKVMIEINISGDERKFGIAPDDAGNFLDSLITLENIDVVGIMAIAPYDEPEETRSYFRQMKRMNDSLKLAHLSMGMSNDYVIAVEEGSTMVRLGSAIFEDAVDKT